MNILHIISAPASGGAEIYVKDLSKALSDRGHTLHVAFLEHAMDMGRDARYECLFLEDLNKSNIDTFFIGSKARKMPWLGIVKVRNYVIKNNIEICHVHLTYGAIFTLLLNIPVIYTQHSIKPRLNKALYPLFNKFVTQYVGISQLCSNSLHSYTGQKIITIHNGVSEKKFEGYIRKRALPNDKITISMVGRLNEAKDYLTMLKSLLLLDQEILSRIKVLIAGEGDANYKNSLLKFIDENNLQNTVEFVGLERNVVKFLYNSDIFLMTSAWEGLPIALIEATMSGLPCIVTNVGGCAELIEKCNNGIIVPPSNPTAVARALAKLMENPEVFKTYSMNAIANSNYYSIDKAAEEHIRLYTYLIKSNQFHY